MYVEHFGLSAAPFQLTPDPRYWFESATHRKAMAYLAYGLAQGEGFVVVTGEIGAGKTTLIGHLLDQLDPARHQVIMIVTAQVEDRDLLRFVAQGFGLASEGAEKAQLIERIGRHAAEAARAGRKTLVIVDEAQALGDSALEELRLLSNIQSSGQALIQILLVGQPEFRDRIVKGGPHEQLRQRVIAQHHLETMSAEETRAYLEHRLRQAGWVSRPLFTDGACLALHHVSGGLPRPLNMLAGRLLLLAALENQDQLTEDMVARVADEQASEQGPVLAYADGFKSWAKAVPVGDSALAARVTLLERVVASQDQAIERLLTMMVEWAAQAERVQSAPAGPSVPATPAPSSAQQGASDPAGFGRFRFGGAQ